MKCPSRYWLREPKPIQRTAASAQPSQLSDSDKPSLVKSQGKMSLLSQRPSKATTTADPSKPTSPIMALVLTPDSLAADTGNRRPSISTPYKNMGAKIIPQRTCQVIPSTPN